jgi:hypothetical protein
MNKVSIGKIVHYILNEGDAAEINRRRTTSKSIKERLVLTTWPPGAQAHYGNQVMAGQELPAVVVAVFNNESGICNLKVLLDGNDDYWATSRSGSDEPTPFHWHWPEREQLPDMPLQPQ